MQEDKLKERIESLNPLSVGVVFGKEDAWDKLQSRLEAKPQRKILPVYWWAAAVLLLLLGFAVIFRQTDMPATQLGSNTKNSATNIASPLPEKKAEAKIIEPSHPAAPVVPHTTTACVETAITMKINPLPVAAHKLAPPAIKLAPLPAIIPYTDPVPVANVVVPALVVKQPMKVVHINELGRLGDEPVKPAFADNSHPDIDWSNLPVVHINDISKNGFKQYYEVLELKNKGSIFTFMKPTNQFGFTTANQTFNGAMTRLKIKIN